MADKPKKIYWDTSVFLCFLNHAEAERRKIAEDVLIHARDGEVLIYTSWFTVVEVIRPKFFSKPEKLTPEQIAKIEGMFKWKWLKKLQVHEKVAFKAVELARDFGLSPADSIHAATAYLYGVDVLQKWDRDFNRVAHLIKVEEPQLITKQLTLVGIGGPKIGPTPDDFEEPLTTTGGTNAKTEKRVEQAVSSPTDVSGSGVESPEDQAGTEGGTKA